MMKKLHFLIPVMIILLIVGNMVLLVRNLKYLPDEEISKNQLPLYNVEELVVDDKGNYYIGNSFNEYIQIFDAQGNYKNTLNLSGGSSSFTVHKNKITVFSYGQRQNEKNTVDLETMKIIESKEISDSQSENEFVAYSQMQERFYKLNGTTYKIERNPILYNKIQIIKNGKNETVILKNMPIFPIPFFVHLGIFVLLFWALALYTYIVLHLDKIKKKISGKNLSSLNFILDKKIIREENKESLNFTKVNKHDWNFNIDIEKTKLLYSNRCDTIIDSTKQIPELVEFFDKLGIDIQKPDEYDSDFSDVVYTCIGFAESETGYEIDIYGNNQFVSVVIMQNDNNRLKLEVFGMN